MRTDLRAAAAVTRDPRTGDRGGAPSPTPPAGAGDAPRAAATAGDPRTGGRGGVLRRRLSTAVLWLSSGSALLLVASMAGILPVQVMRVDSDSMNPTIEVGDLLVVQDAVGEVRRGDVVAVQSPIDDEVLVKRAVGVGGDEVAIEDGVLIVNGAEVCEPVIDPLLIDSTFHGPLTVPEGSLFLLSDMRDRSIDSRVFGPVSERAVVGEVAGRLWPHPGPLPGLGDC